MFDSDHDVASAEHRHHFRWWFAADAKGERAGFDEGALHTMQSQLIPVGGHRLVGRFWPRGVTVYSDQPSIATVETTGRHSLLRAFAPGSSVIHAVNDHGVCWSALAVVVKRLYSVPVAFHRVVDQKGRRSSRASGQVRDLLDSVNSIFAPQTGLTFHESQKGAVQAHTIAEDLGDAVDVAQIFRQLRQHEVSGALNIFFVWELEKTAQHDDVGGLMHGDHVFLADRPPGNAGRRLAHEIGHVFTHVHEAALGYVGSHASHAGLMDATGSATAITRKEAEFMYKDAVSRGVVRGVFLE